MEDPKIVFPYPPLPDPSAVGSPDSFDIVPYQQVPHVFGKAEYKMDIEENLGYRTPFRDANSAQAEKIFDDIIKARRQKRTSSSTE